MAAIGVEVQPPPIPAPALPSSQAPTLPFTVRATTPPATTSSIVSSSLSAIRGTSTSSSSSSSSASITDERNTDDATPDPNRTQNTDQRREPPEDNDYDDQDLVQLRVLRVSNESLRLESSELRTMYDKHVSDQKEIIWYLHQEINQKDEIVAELAGKHEDLVESKETMIKEFARKWDAEHEKHADHLSTLEEQMDRLAKEYDLLASLGEQKATLEAELNKYKELLENERKTHRLQISDLERRSVSERQRLKSEMVRKIKETKMSLLAMTEDQLHTTTRRTIKENEETTIELHFQSKKTEKLLADNRALTAKSKSMQLTVELHEKTEEMLEQRTVQFQTKIKKLNDALKTLAMEQKDAQSKVKQLERTKQLGQQQAETTIATLEAHLDEYESALGESVNTGTGLRSDLEAVQHETRRVIGLQDEAVLFLLACIEDVNHQLFRTSDLSLRERHWSADDAFPASIEQLTLADRLHLLELLVTKLKLVQQEQQNDAGAITSGDHDDDDNDAVNFTLPPIQKGNAAGVSGAFAGGIGATAGGPAGASGANTTDAGSDTELSDGDSPGPAAEYPSFDAPPGTLANRSQRKGAQNHGISPRLDRLGDRRPASTGAAAPVSARSDHSAR